jgi:FixJ family two-component response regulator
MSDADRLNLIDLGYRQLSTARKREVIARILKRTPEYSNRAIAHPLGVDNKTVAAIRHELEICGDVPLLSKTIGLDGKWRSTTPRGRPSRRYPARSQPQTSDP